MLNGKAHSTVRFLPLSGRRATLVGLYWMSVAEEVWRLERGGGRLGRIDDTFDIYFAELKTC